MFFQCNTYENKTSVFFKMSCDLDRDANNYTVQTLGKVFVCVCYVSGGKKIISATVSTSDLKNSQISKSVLVSHILYQPDSSKNTTLFI